MPKKTKTTTKTNEDYWRDREDAWEKKNKKDEEKYYKDIEKIYKQQKAEIEKEILAFYAKYAVNNELDIAEVKKICSKLDMEEYERKAEEYVKNKTFTPEANAEMSVYNLTMKTSRLDLLKAKLNLVLKDRGSEAERKTAQALYDQTVKEYERHAGILGKYLPDPRKMADVTVNASFHGATWSKRIWKNQRKLRTDLNKIISSGLIQGKNPRDYVRQLEQAHSVSAANALRLLRTEFTRVRVQASLDSYKASGIEEVIYVTGNEDQTCDVCKGKDGTVIKLKDVKIGENAPPVHPNCRCNLAPYAEKDTYEEWVNSESELPYEEYEKLRNEGLSDDEIVNRSKKPDFDFNFTDRDEAQKAILEKSSDFRKSVMNDFGLSDPKNISKLYSSGALSSELKYKYEELKALSDYTKTLPLTLDQERKVRIQRGHTYSELRKTVTKGEYAYMKRKLANCDLPELAELYHWIESRKIKLVNHSSGGAWFSSLNKQVVCNVKSVCSGDSCHGPLYTFFHEYGHAIDGNAGVALLDGKNRNATWWRLWYSTGGDLYAGNPVNKLSETFRDTLENEGKALVKAWESEIKKAVKSYEKTGKMPDQKMLDLYGLDKSDLDDMCYSDLSYMRREYFSDCFYNRLKNDAERIFNEKFKGTEWYGGEKRTAGARMWGDVSDMIEGASVGKIHPGVGHGTSYWSKKKNPDWAYQCLEAFAEMSSATVDCPESLEMIKLYFPESYKAYRELVIEMKNELAKDSSTGVR